LHDKKSTDLNNKKKRLDIMALENIITVLFVILIAFFAWGLFKRLFKLLFYVGIVIIILIAANTYFIFKDVTDLKKNFADSTKKVILVDKNEVLTGFLLNGEVNFLSEQQIEELSVNLAEEDFKNILGDSYKLMVFDIAILENLDDEEIEINEKRIATSAAISALKSDRSLASLDTYSINEEDLEIAEEDASDNSKVKAALFGSILANDVLSPKNPLFFFSEYKKRNIAIYPETALFKTVKFIPSSFIKSTGKKIFGKAKERAKTLAVEASE
jgi:hypothetical protein